MNGVGELFINEHKLHISSLAAELKREDSALEKVLEKEEIISIITSKMNRTKMSMKIYVFTDYATLISLTYLFQRQDFKMNRQSSNSQDQDKTKFQILKDHNIRNLTISDHLKQMTGFKISKIIADEKYPVCMLIEQGIICYIASFNDDVSLNNFKQGDLCAGLVQCKLNDPCEMSLSKNKKFILVSNKQTIEIYIANENQSRTNIILDLVLIVNYDSLPLLIDSIHDFRFSNSDNNVFYAIGKHNPEFYEQAADVDEDSFGTTINHKIEKFYIENESFSSETVATFEMDNDQEEVHSYCFSDSLCKVVVLSDRNNLYSFMLKESVEKINILKGTSIKENICMIKWYFNDTLLAVLTTKNKILILDTYLRLYSMSVVSTFGISKEFRPVSQFIDLQVTAQSTYDQKK